MGAARHRSRLISALVLVMLSAVSPPAARAQQSVEGFRQSLLDLAAALDSQGGVDGAFALQQDVAEASPEAIEMIQHELARQGAPNAVQEALQHLTPPPQVARLSTTDADVNVTKSLHGRQGSSVSSARLSAVERRACAVPGRRALPHH